MLWHTLLITYRTFRRSSSVFIINLLGLSTGLASTLLIYLWVNSELNMDKFHEKGARIYHVMESHLQNDGWNTLVETSGAAAEALATEMPEVEYATAIAPPMWPGFDKFVLSVDGRNIRATGQYAGKDYFNIFSYKLIEGQPDEALKDKNSIVISEDIALRLFGKKHDVIGKTIGFQHEREFIISGVFENVPTTSSTRFDFVLPFETFAEQKAWALDWHSSGPYVYLLLREGTNVEAFNNKIKDFSAKKIDTNLDDSRRKTFVVNYEDVYLYGNYENGVQSGGRIEYVKLFSLIAGFILMIACVNFMNLSTARAMRRTKEVGVKKTFGVSRGRLIVQYLAESMLMTCLSLLAALALVGLVLSEFNIITGKQLTLEFDKELVTALIVITAFVGFFAGSYPAFYLSGFNVISVLKGKLQGSLSEVWIRKGLVGFQFTLSIILIVSVVIVYKQIEFVQQKNLGYNKDNVIYFDVEGRIKENPETFLAEIKKIPGVVTATSSTHDLVGHGWSSSLNWEGKQTDDFIPVEIMAVNHDFLETMGMEMKEGRFFSRDFIADTAKVVLNEAAIEVMGMENPIGRVAMGREIIGVVKNFHFESLHVDVKPQLFSLHGKTFAPPSLIIARIEAGKEVETLARLNDFYKSYNEGFPFQYTFLDAMYQKEYVSEQRVSVLSGYFAGLAILISCLGLFGLAAFTAQRRVKEIGIRKILGASRYGIVQLLTKDFTATVLAAIVIGLPSSYILASKWLESYAYRIQLEWWYFAGAGAAALLIAWFTVGVQTFRAASINPTESLKEN